MFDLTGRRAFVSGAAGRLGSAMARGLAEAGAGIVVNGRTEESLTRLAGDLSSDGFNADIAVFDMSDAASRGAYFKDQERIDVLVNNAYSGKTNKWPDVSEQDFRDAYEIGVVANYGAIQDATPSLLKAVDAAGQASVINIGSMYGAVSPDPRRPMGPQRRRSCR